MKSTDLRITNLVNDEDLQPMYIAGLWPTQGGDRFIDSAGNTGKCSILFGIPFTEDWLVRLGFEEKYLDRNVDGFWNGDYCIKLPYFKTDESTFYFQIGDYIIKKIMKIYEVHYRNDEDNNMFEFYTDKATAVKRHNKLKSIEATSSYEDDNNGVNMLYDLSDFEVEISKKGILNLLNAFFYTDR